MPRIRKKPSKRGSTNQREKIKHKAAETRKKRKKDAKKITQWKTKHPKDLGIPNNFPYKDQILAEVAEERRRAVEEKERRKAEKKSAKAKISSENGSDAESEVAFDGVSAVTGGATKTSSGKEKALQVDAKDVEEDVPVLINRDLSDLKTVLDIADVVIQVLDARDPLPYRSTHIEEIAGEKKMLLVLNKVDACPREAIVSWVATLRGQCPTVLFRSASAFLPKAVEPSSRGKAKDPVDDAWGVDAILSCLGSWAQQKQDEKPLVVAVVGVANVGKSSVINSLLKRAALVIYTVNSTALEGSTTTTHPQEVEIEFEGKQIRLIDTPGVSWHPVPDDSRETTEKIRAQDILVRSRGRIERLKNPVPVVAAIVSRSDREDIMLFYNLPAFADRDTNAFLSGVARSNGLIKKGGVLDLSGASRIVLRDWSTGKFLRYTMPASPAPTSASDTAPAEVYAKDEEVVSRLFTLKEMRRAGGAIKMTAGPVETRKVVLDASWMVSDDEDGNEGDEEEDEDELDEDVSGGVDEEDEDQESGGGDVDEDEDEDSDDAPVRPSGKRKRGVTKISTPPPRPLKKVAFSAEPKGTKQARAAAGAKGSRTTTLEARSKSAEDKPVVKSKAAVAVDKASKTKHAMKKTARHAVSQKVANSSSKNTAPREGEEVYDFKKFF
ncbi:hypothetical protein BKA93DRAFT_139941 [Sparassis latifolia]|uniref:Nuclear GTP-binding protein n=1 Tax=Sparassis crispa TaxID=139825 RepID=A0A401GAD4_9APHY|nr:Nuclear GTP-binding protein [Sparassis crispa]GBE79130.1 Nuclear GTP-binding protein [Sparassis crispa]